jgi:Domain of unknown function (DUF5076)
MAFVTDLEIYDALPIPNDALDKGGVEMLRAGVVEEELFVTARRAFADPAPWGYVLADIVRRLAALYAADGDFTEAKASAAIAAAFDESLRRSGTAAAPRAAKPKAAKPKPAKSVRSRSKARSKAKTSESTKSPARRKRARAKT